MNKVLDEKLLDSRKASYDKDIENSMLQLKMVDANKKSENYRAEIRIVIDIINSKMDDINKKISNKDFKPYSLSSLTETHNNDIKQLIELVRHLLK